MVVRGEDSLPLSEIDSVVIPELSAELRGSVTVYGEDVGDDENDGRTLSTWGGWCDAHLCT